MDTNPAAAPAAPTLDERLESLLHGYALEIGAKALAGDVAGMHRAQRFHHQVTQIRDHWVNGNASPVRTPKAPAAAPAAIAEVRS